MTYASLPNLIWLLGITLIGFWRAREILGVAGLLWAIYGFTYWITSNVWSIGLVVVGILVFFRTFWGGMGKKREE